MKTRPRILIVDDESNIRLMLRATLAGELYRLSEAHDGREALDLIDAEGPALVVLDLNMPVLDGMSVLRRLHTLPPESRRAKVVVLTEYGSIPAAMHAVRLGASDFLVKPTTPADLRLSVAAVLEELAEDAGAGNPGPARGPADYDGVLAAVRADIWAGDHARPERLLNDVAKRAAADSAYFNLLGVLHEAEGDGRAARTFYRKAVALGGHEPARRNLRRLYEIETYGETRQDVALGDEGDLLAGFHWTVGGNRLRLVRRALKA